MIRVNKRNGAAKVRIEGELTIHEIAKVNGKLQKCVDDADRIEISLEGVTEIDTAGVQALIMAKKAAVGRGRDLQLVKHSQPVVDTFELLDVTRFFGDPVVLHD